MRLRTGLALLLTAIAIGSGCRDLVDPDAVEELGPMRTVEGRITGLDAVSFDQAVVNVYPTFEEKHFETVSVVAGADGRFRFEVERGRRPEVQCEVLWPPATRIPSWYFDPVQLTDQLVLHHPVERFAGRVRVPDGLAPDGLEDVELHLAEVVFTESGELIAHRLRDSVRLDAEGRFEAWLPPRSWRLALDLEELDSIDDGEVQWYRVAPGEDIELVVPLVRMPVRLARPAVVPAGTTLALVTDSRRYGDVPEGAVGVGMLDSFPADGSESTVWTVDSQPEPQRYVSRWESGRELGRIHGATVTRVDDPGGPLLEIDAGAHVLTVRLQEDGVAPSQRFRVEVYGFDGWSDAATDDDGVAMLFLEPGTKRIRVDLPGGRAIWRDLHVPETLEITLEIGDTNAPATD